ncbi:MAG: PaaI family thioesterase [Alphaproteobacteria bacterium]|nr:PaaI family thioesterase [Alphaproteobacteria bacterium]
MALLDAVAEAKRTRDFSPLATYIPYARFLGLSLREEGENLITVMAQDLKLVGNPVLPALHGGTVGALLESAALFQILWTAEVTRIPKTISITVDYLRSARPVETYARGIINKQGRRIANVRVEAWQDDPAKPVALAHGHFLLA